MTYQDLFFLQIEYLVESACKSGFLVFVSYDSQFVFVLRRCCRSIQYSASKKASYQGVMIITIIEMPFVLTKIMEGRTGLESGQEQKATLCSYCSWFGSASLTSGLG